MNDKDGGQGQAQIEGRAGEIIQATPPREVFPADDFLEDEADDAPAEVVEGGGGGGCAPRRRR
ncbi:hypothetical protein NHQ30_010383 [Ciborinia camelliae]|nr:hypothetical protein NHQ30_010383 [Ciborinia camelliae]